jgi:hypothetical protein
MTATEKIEKQRDLANAELIEVRPGVGQLYKLDRPVVKFDTVWLSGITMASNVKVGDKGKLVYRSGASYGLYFFVKGQSMPEVSNDN